MNYITAGKAEKLGYKMWEMKQRWVNKHAWGTFYHWCNRYFQLSIFSKTYLFQLNLTHMQWCIQLWVYNLGIHDCVSDKGIISLWDETTAKRGSSEVVSCLYRCLIERRTGAKHLVLFYLWWMLRSLLPDLPPLSLSWFMMDNFNKSITSQFLVHDCNFSVIEKRKKL